MRPASNNLFWKTRRVYHTVSTPSAPRQSISGVIPSERFACHPEHETTYRCRFACTSRLNLCNLRNLRIRLSCHSSLLLIHSSLLFPSEPRAAASGPVLLFGFSLVILRSGARKDLHLLVLSRSSLVTCHSSLLLIHSSLLFPSEPRAAASGGFLPSPFSHLPSPRHPPTFLTRSKPRRRDRT